MSDVTGAVVSDDTGAVVSDVTGAVVSVVGIFLTVILPSLPNTRSEMSLPFASNTLMLSISTTYTPSSQSAGIVYSSSITVLPSSDLMPAPIGLANAYSFFVGLATTEAP